VRLFDEEGRSMFVEASSKVWVNRPWIITVKGPNIINFQEMLKMDRQYEY
jgi:hypothetical protein